MACPSHEIPGRIRSCTFSPGASMALSAPVLSSEEEEGQPGEAVSQEGKRLCSLSTPLVKTWHGFVMSPEGWDEGPQFRAGQEYPA